MFNKLINIRIRNIRLSFMISIIQTLKGITSQVKGENMHYILMDFDSVIFTKVFDDIFNAQTKYNLGDFYLISDRENSWRAICFSKRTFKEYMNILLECKYVDKSFKVWTLKREKGTIRLSNKIDRTKQKLMILRGHEKTTIPENFKFVYYETGKTKIKNVVLGK